MSEERCAARFTHRYDAALAEVWRALTEPESLTRWLAPPHGVTVVRIELYPEGENTVLVLEHSRIEATLGMRYMRDWAWALERFEGELNLRRNT